MKEELISVIIPIYNVEAYVKECIQSVCKQTYTNLQIILVDDGSTDSCGIQCDEMGKLDSRIIVIHKENGGLSDARNAGILQATGSYIFYLDSDDYLEKDAIESLMKKQIKYGAQIVIGNYYYTYSDHEDCAKSAFNEDVALTKGEAMEALVTGKLQNFAWGKLIRADIAKEVQFPKGKLFEDNYWAHLILDKSEKVIVSDKPIVHYRQRDNSISYTFNIKRLDILEGWMVRKEFLEKNYPELVSSFMKHIAKNYLEIAWLVLTHMKTKRNEAFRILRQYNQELQLQNYVDGHQKILICKLDQSNFAYFMAAVFIRLKRGI